MRQLHSTLFLVFIQLSSPSTVTWMRSAIFNSPDNFEGGIIPCSRQNVLFPEELQEPIRIVSNVSVNEIILPDDGELFFDDVIIELGEDPEEKCEREGNVKFKDILSSSWEDPDVWSSEKFNEATPDAERVPCYGDTVVFPKVKEMTIELPKVTQYIKKLMSDDKGKLATIYDLSSLDESMFIMGDTGLTLSYADIKCSSKDGCPCQINMPQINCYKKVCPEPKCLYPIQPTGHCCKICGGIITFATTPSFNMATFKETITNIVDSYGNNELAYHVAKLPQTWDTIDAAAGVDEIKKRFNDNSGKIQVVIVETGEYTGRSTEAINDLYHIMSKLESKSLSLSGYPIDKVGFGWKVFISMFFVAVAIMGTIYVYYYRVPNHWARNLSFNLSIPGIPVLSRFQRRSESVLSLARRDSAVSRVSAGGFRNPLYDSKRGRVVVAEPVEEED